MTGREAILGRIRDALTLPAPVPGNGDSAQTPPLSGWSSAEQCSAWLPAVGTTFAERLALFQQNSTDLQTDFRVVDSKESLFAAIHKMATGWRRIASHSGELTDTVCGQLGLPVCRTDGRYDVTELESCDAGITQCDALIAQTGSVLVTSRSAGGRSLSVLPPHHIVLARYDQLIPDLPTAFSLLEQLYSPNYPSLISFITGPSRTGDIERIIVLGAHGPKALTVFLVC